MTWLHGVGVLATLTCFGAIYHAHGLRRMAQAEHKAGKKSDAQFSIGCAAILFVFGVVSGVVALVVWL